MCREFSLDCKSFRCVRRFFVFFLSRAVCWSNSLATFAICFERGEYAVNKQVLQDLSAGVAQV